MDDRDERYLLRWHRHEATLSRRLPALLESESLTDCAISAGNRTFKAHRLVLAMCSSYFLEMFQNSGTLEIPIIVLHNTIPEDVEAILSYMYRGQCLVTNGQLPRLMSLAKSLKIQGLSTMKMRDGETSPLTENHQERTNYKDHKTDVRLPNEHNRLGNTSDVTDLDYDELLTPKSQTECKLGEDVREDSPTPHTPFEMVESQRKRHIRDSPEVCKCFICGKYLSNHYNLRVHMETHKDAYYSCFSCPHVSKSRDALRKHISYRHPNEYIYRKRKKV